MDSLVYQTLWRWVHFGAGHFGAGYTLARGHFGALALEGHFGARAHVEF